MKNEHIGLEFSEIEKILEDEGIISSEVIPADKLREAIAKAILQNNYKITQQVNQFIFDFEKDIDKLSRRY